VSAGTRGKPRQKPSTSSDECIFCRIVRGEEPCEGIYRGRKTLAFMDIRPVNDGHCLVIAKAHFESIFEMPPELFGLVACAAARVARVVGEVLRPDGLSLVQANGAFAGQTVRHLHVHVLPRRDGDNLLMNWDRGGTDSNLADRARIAEIAGKLRARLALKP
jgi:histidine triad (HIT) family protein